MKDSAAEFLSGRHRLAGEENARQDLYKEFRIIPMVNAGRG
jgi:hypothetical protein